MLRDDGVNSHVITETLFVAPGDILVLGRSINPATNGGLSGDYAYDGFSLSNGSDEVIIECLGIQIDEVAYDNGSTFPDPTGASMSLDPAAFSAIANDAGANWCTGSTPYGAGDLGSPGVINPSCP